MEDHIKIPKHGFFEYNHKISRFQAAGVKQNKLSTRPKMCDRSIKLIVFTHSKTNMLSLIHSLINCYERESHSGLQSPKKLDFRDPSWDDMHVQIKLVAL